MHARLTCLKCGRPFRVTQETEPFQVQCPYPDCDQNVFVPPSPREPAPSRLHRHRMRRKQIPIWMWSAGAGAVLILVVAVAAFTRPKENRRGLADASLTETPRGETKIAIQHERRPDQVREPASKVAANVPNRHDHSDVNRGPKLETGRGSVVSAPFDPSLDQTLEFRNREHTKGPRDSLLGRSNRKPVDDSRDRQTAVAKPPIRLVAGQRLPGRRLRFPQLRIESGVLHMEIGGSELTTFGPPSEESSTPEIDPSARRGLARTPGFQIGMGTDRIDFEIRPKGKDELELDAIITDARYVGVMVQFYLWKDQPYEILDADLKVVYSYPDVKDLGTRRAPLPVPQLDEFDGVFDPAVQ
jgi:hypothetical protein